MSVLEKIFFKPKRKIGQFVADVTIEEAHNDSSTITEHPVERGSAITDHIYRNPNQLTVVAGWTNSTLKAVLNQTRIRSIYEKVLALKESGEPFDVITGKRAYRNMVIQTLATTTNKDTEHSLILTFTMREIIIVETQSTIVPPAKVQDEPQKTQEVASAGTKQLAPAPTAKTSALATIFGK